MSRILFAGALLLLLPVLAFAGPFERSREAIAGKDYDRAIALLNAYLRENPTFAPAFNNRGVAYLRKKEYDRALADFTRAIRLNPNRVFPYANRGLANSAQQEYDKAIEDYGAAIRLDPGYAPAFFGRGYAYKRQKKYDQAILDYAETIRLNPTFAAAYNNLAWVLATCPKDAVRDGGEAVEHATKACALSRWKNANQLGTLAAAYAEAGNFKEAVKWEKKALELGYENKNAERKGAQRLKLYEGGKAYREE